MKVAEETLTQLESLLKEQLEADIITIIAERLSVSPDAAMRVYFRSPLAQQIEEGAWGMQYLDASYLADEILKAR